MEKAIYFVSDLHFGVQSSEEEKIKERKFVKFLKHAQKDASELYIVGDLFDYWFEYRRVIQKGYFRTLTALQDLTEAGVKLHYLIGNHDFLHRDFFEKEIGVKLYPNYITREIDGKKFFIAHGDGLVKNDFGYKILKSILRNNLLQKAYSFLHPDFGIWLASLTSKGSRGYTDNKYYAQGDGDGLYEKAVALIDNGYDYVIFGHSHIRKFEKHKNGFYINLGSWLDKPCYGKFFQSKFDIFEWNDYE